MKYIAPRISGVQTLEGALTAVSKTISDADVKHNVTPTDRKDSDSRS